MCPKPPACAEYMPDWGKWDQEGNGCTGMGASPDCLGCGQSEREHIVQLPCLGGRALELEQALETAAREQHAVESLRDTEASG